MPSTTLKTAVFLAFLFLATPAAAKDTLVIGITQYPSTFHPNIDSMVAKTYVLAATHRDFTIYNPDWKPVCLLCTELPSLENSLARIVTRKDGTKAIDATYTIHEGAKWGDGTPITTKDVLFTWEVGRHREVGTANFELFANDIVDITAHDDRRFTLHFDKVTCDFASIDDFHLIPEHLERAVFEEDPARYQNRTLYDADTTNPGLYSGPYVITEALPGTRISLAPNPYWWGKKPFFKKVTLKIIENSAALSANLLSGDVDMIAGELGMLTDQALVFEKRLQKERPGAYTVMFKPGLIYEHIDFNLDAPELRDVRVRRALIHAIDREALSKHLFAGHQPVAHSNVNPLDNVYSGKFVFYDYDPEKAKDLLKKAGFTDRKLTLEIMTTAGTRTRELVQQVLQSNWRDIGIDVRIRNEPPRVLFGETIRKRKFRHMTMYAWLSAPRNIPRTTLHSSMIPAEENGWAGQNYPGFKNARMDEVLDDMETVCEADKNQALWDEMQQIYTSELPVIPLYFRAEPYILPVWLKGIIPTGHQYPTTYWIEHWTAEQ